MSPVVALKPIDGAFHKYLPPPNLEHSFSQPLPAIPSRKPSQGGVLEIIHSSSSTKKPAKSYKVLGDYEEFEEKLAEEAVPPPPPEPDTVDNTDPSEFPGDVWAAAALLPDRGASIIRVYRELVQTRETYQAKLATIHTSRQLKQLSFIPGSSNALHKSGKTITEAIMDGADPRKLDMFQRYSREWEGLAHMLGNKTNRPDFDLAMNRGPEWRGKQEMLQALDSAIPIEDRTGGADAWHMSLRDAWERIVPLGNMFSGLYMTIRDKPKDLPLSSLVKVGRPLDPPVDLLAACRSSAISGKSLTLRGRDWQHSQWLKSRQSQYSKNLHKAFPYDPDMRSLALHGEALEVQLQGLAYASITLAEVLQHLSSADPAAFEAYMAIKQQQEQERLAAEAAEAASREQEAAAAAAAGPRPGPHVELSCQRLLLHAVAGHADSASFNLRHCGTAAVYYTWQRCPHHPPPFAQPPNPNPTFYLAKQSGVLLPGHTAMFTVSFKSQQPGSFSEKWVLATTPSLLGTPLTITVQGVAVTDDLTLVQQKVITDELVEQEKMRKVHAALERILTNANPQPPTSPSVTPEEATQHEAFERANFHISPPIYYPGPDCYAQLQQLYAEARQLFEELQAPPPEEKKKGNSKNRTPEPPPPPPKYLQQWDSSMATAGALVDDVARLQPATATRFQDELAAANAALPIPPMQRHMLQHAVRAMVGRMADAVAIKLDGIRADYQQRLAEQAAAAQAAEDAAAAAAAAGANPSTPAAAAAAVSSMPKPPGTAARIVDGTWYAEKCKVGAKNVVKGSINLMWEELAQNKEAVGDVLEGQLHDKDAAIEQASTAADGASNELEDLLWERFTLLRTWTRLGIPPRGEYVRG